MGKKLARLGVGVLRIDWPQTMDSGKRCRGIFFSALDANLADNGPGLNFQAIPNRFVMDNWACGEGLRIFCHKFCQLL
jgi:hypothetical protein